MTTQTPVSTSQQQQQQQTRVMHHLATQSKDPITKAVATNIVGVQKKNQIPGNVLVKRRSFLLKLYNLNIIHILCKFERYLIDLDSGGNTGIKRSHSQISNKKSGGSTNTGSSTSGGATASSIQRNKKPKVRNNYLSPIIFCIKC